MKICELTVANFRPHLKKTIKFNSQKTALIGPNGCGKTSLIEAVYVLLRGKSFRGTDQDILKFNSDWYRIDGLFSNGNQEQRTLKFQVQNERKNKEFIVNNKTHRRLIQSVKRPIILFQPDDLNLINGSPNRRRQFIDDLISQIQPEYSGYLNRYEKALRQRNNLLKQQIETGKYDSDFLFSWNIILGNYGSKIIRSRVQLIKQINQLIQETYQKITGSYDEIKVEYSERYEKLDSIQQVLFNQLSDHFIATPVGPHRHDIIFTFNNQPAAQHASRGEVRSLILALKIIEQQIVKKSTNYQPIILLDDVLSELDEQRRRFLIDNLEDSQVIITTTEVLNYPGLEIIDLSCD